MALKQHYSRLISFLYYQPQPSSEGSFYENIAQSLLYCWENSRIHDFYDHAKHSDADIIYLGEAVCAKRKELRLEEWLEIGKTLEAHGKEVVLTSLALVDSPQSSKMSKMPSIMGYLV